MNSLIKQTLLPIYTLSSTPKEGPTTTPYAQEVPLELSNQKFRVIDTPGFAWLANPEETLENSEKLRARDILTRSRGRIDRLKDPLPVGTFNSWVSSTNFSFLQLISCYIHQLQRSFPERTRKI